MKYPGFFISLEGIDGSGKTTLLNALKQHFISQNKELTCLREPGGTIVSEAIRQILLNPAYSGITPKTEAFLYAAARAQVCSEVIQPALEQGHIVIADRYTDSTLAYQGYGRGLDLDFLKNLIHLCTSGIKPDLTLLLDLNPEIAIQERKQLSKKKDRLEQEGVNFQKEVRTGYLELAQKEPHRIICLNAILPKEQLLKESLFQIKKHYLERNASHDNDSTNRPNVY